MISGLLAAIAVFSAADYEPQVAFVRGTSQEDRTVCLLDVASGQVTPLGRGTGDGAPAWSPNGSWIAYDTREGDGLVIRMVNPDTGETRRLNHRLSWNEGPIWAPPVKMLDGTRDPGGRFITYTAGQGLDTVPVVYDLETDTEEVWGGGRAGLLRPVWVNGNAILVALRSDYGADWSGIPDIEEAASQPHGILLAAGLVESEGRLSTEALLVTRASAWPIQAVIPAVLRTRKPYVEWGLTQAPNGRSFAFETNDGGDREIFILSFLQGMYNASNHRVADWNPVWSPRSDWLAFESFRSGRRGVYLLHPATVRTEALASSAAHDNWSPAWSPDAAWVAYVSNRDGAPRLYATEVETGRTDRLTEGDVNEYAPAFRPRPRQRSRR